MIYKMEQVLYQLIKSTHDKDDFSTKYFSNKFIKMLIICYKTRIVLGAGIHWERR